MVTLGDHALCGSGGSDGIYVRVQDSLSLARGTALNVHGLVQGVHLNALARLCDGVERLQATVRTAKQTAGGGVHAADVQRIADRCGLLRGRCKRE